MINWLIRRLARAEIHQTLPQINPDRPPETVAELNAMIEYIRSRDYGFAFGTYGDDEFTGEVYLQRVGVPSSFKLMNWTAKRSIDVKGDDLVEMIYNAFYLVWLAED